MPTQQNTACDDAITDIRFPIRLLTVACLLTIMAFAWFGWIIFKDRRDAKTFTDRLSRIEELRGVLVHLDEVLSMSARMAATTGDPKWEERHRRFQPQLDAAIKETINIGANSSSIKAATKTDAANLKLAEMKKRAFALVRASRKEAAQAVLFSPEYDAQAKIYAEGMQSFHSQNLREAAERKRQEKRIGFLSMIGALVVLAISFAAWLSVVRNLQRWRSDLEQAASKRRQAERALRCTHDELEVRVEEHTAELGKTNQTLQAEITERKRAEGTLRESEENFRQLADNITDVFWITSPDLKTIHYLSAGYKEIWGRSTESLYAHPHQLAEAILPEDRERVLAVFATLMETEPEVSVEYRIVRPDGTVRWVYDRGFQVRNAAGNVVRLTGLASDTTERKRTEAQLFQSQKMETVGKLAGGIAHEFNSILTAIIGQSELLLGDLPAESPLAKNATEISTAAGRAATLTRQLLAYGRKQFLQPETLDLNRVTASMEGMFRHLMGADVDTKIVPAPGLQAVKADAGQIEQVIMNMAINARDAMPNGGKLTLETANVSFDQESIGRYPELKPGGYVMLAITDTGIGMSEEVKARVFEPFFSTKGVGQGAGLGLSTCYGIVKQSGGHISVYSELGRGTILKIYLPQVEPQAKIPLQRLDSPDLPRGTETILLVEDDPALREMAATLLRRLGYTVLAAANGIEALSLKQQRDIGHIDLLFTDVVMPHMSGRELSERVQALYPHTRILFTSAYTENAIVHQGVLDKGVALLQKPFTPSALAYKLREVLDPPSAPKPDPTQRTFGFTTTMDGVNTL